MASNIQQLAAALDSQYKPHNNLSTVINVLKSYQGNDWQNIVKFSKDKYCRSPVIVTNNYEILLLGWESMQHTTIHDHPRGGCILMPLLGSLQEDLIDPDNLEVKSTQHISMHTVAYIDNQTGLHKMTNISDTRSVSIHIYAPANYQPNCY